MSLSNTLFRKLLLCGFVLAGVFCTAQPIRADLVITVSDDGGAPQTFTTTGSPTSDLTVGQNTVTTAHFTIKVLGGEANQIGSGSGATSQLLSSAVSVTETGSGAHSLVITVTGSGYTAPTTPPPVQAVTSFTGNVNASGTGTDGYSFSATAGSTTIASNSASGAFAIPPGSFTPTNSTVGISSLSAPFSIQHSITLNMSVHNEKINYSSQTTLTSVPAPAGLILAVTGLPCLGFGAWLRRRKVKAMS
jgi:hypothetical protein